MMGSPRLFLCSTRKQDNSSAIATRSWIKYSISRGKAQTNGENRTPPEFSHLGMLMI